MRLNKELSNLIFTKLEGVKHITRVAYTQEDINNVFFTINEINALDRDMRLLNGYDLDLYKIPQEFSKLIVPSRVKMNAHAWALDVRSTRYKTNAMLDLDDKGNPVPNDKLKVLNPDEFQRVWQCIYGAFKKQHKITNILPSELRGESDVPTVSDRLKTEDKLNISELKEFPIEVSIQLYQDFMYGVSDYDFMRDKIQSIIDAIETLN